jgi:hypothetical protein
MDHSKLIKKKTKKKHWVLISNGLFFKESVFISTMYHSKFKKTCVHINKLDHTKFEEPVFISTMDHSKFKKPGFV